MNRGTHTQLIAYHTIGAWGTGSDDADLIQSTKAPKGGRERGVGFIRRVKWRAASDSGARALSPLSLHLSLSLSVAVV